MSKSRDLVLAAVKQGVSDPKAIVIWTGITSDRVHTELGRLYDLNKIRKEKGRWLPNEAPTLTEVWR